MRFGSSYPTLKAVQKRGAWRFPILVGGLLYAFFSPVSARAQAALICRADLPEVMARPLNAPPSYTEASASFYEPLQDTQHSTAVRHWEKFDSLLSEGRLDEALIGLEFIAERFPSLDDHIRYRRALVQMERGDHRHACPEFARVAQGTIDSALRTISDVAEVRCAFRSGRGDAERLFRRLQNRYAALPEVLALQLERGAMYSRRNRFSQAVRVFRAIDLEHPGSPFAAEARRELEALSERGVRIPHYSTAQKVDRAERLVRQGPMDLARLEVAALLGEDKLEPSLRARVHLAAARIATVEGRWDEVQRHHRAVRGANVDELDERDLGRAEAAAEAADAREKSTAKREIHLLTNGSSNWGALPPFRTVKIIEVAARAGLQEDLDRALRAVRDSSRFGPANKYEAALLAIGSGDDEILIDIFRPLVGVRRLEPGVSYHLGRALERLERWDEAEKLYHDVVEQDQTETRYYAMWSRLRLDVVSAARNGHSPPPPAGSARVAGLGMAGVGAAALGQGRPEAARKKAQLQLPPSVMREQLLRLAEEHGEAYPWFERAAAFLSLGDAERAANELHEAYLAWRFAVGRPLLRAGIEAVYRGKSRRQEFVPRKLRRARAKLAFAQRTTIADIAHVLGDEGTAAGFGGWSRVKARPRAYSKLVTRVAEQNGIDPNLLFAVMRVESVYQRRIVSHAGAVGLMQIMPRTGRLIADQLGYHDFTAADLLDPETNLTFAAWYLASLIERFDGRLPLAVASYNGGPHNVRRWLSMHGEDMPLDAFLEQIPFRETHRYVRRVTTHYQAYRAQIGLGMEQFPTRLPHPSVDEIAF